jgi:niacin transporter
MRDLRAMVISAMMAALALVLPLVFHSVGLGNKFLPMLLPLLLNGFLVPFPWAVLTGAFVPVASAFLTGMPPLYPPVAALLAVEGAVLGGVAALLYRGRRLWTALLCAVLLGRLAGFVLAWLLASAFHLPAAFASLAMVVAGLPGVALQFAVVPLVLRAVERRGGLLFQGDRA